MPHSEVRKANFARLYATKHVDEEIRFGLGYPLRQFFRRVPRQNRDCGFRHDRPLVILAINDVQGYARAGLASGKHGFWTFIPYIPRPPNFGNGPGWMFRMRVGYRWSVTGPIFRM